MNDSQQVFSQVMILTHRRAGLVALMPAFTNAPADESNRWNSVSRLFSQPLLADAAHACECYSNLLTTEPVQQNGFKLYSDRIQFAVAIGDSTTAEVLSKMYNAVLSSCAKGDADVKHLGVGVGPGSFTGLRLGCAFANGLKCGRQRTLYALTNSHLDNLAEHSHALPFSSPFWAGELPTVADDEFAVPVTLMDFFYALIGWPQAQIVDVLQPTYGRLPGPVLKLQGLELAKG